MELKDRIKILSEASGPSGFEDEAAKLAEGFLKPLVDSVYRDSMGNVIGLKSCGKPGAAKLLIETHIDEIGFIITGSEDGFLKFDSIGKVDARLLPASEIKILGDEEFCGIVDTMPPHVLNREVMKKAIPIHDLCIDTGGREAPPGTPAVFAGQFRELTKGVYTGKAMDNRSCFAIALDAIERLCDEKLDIDIYIMASVQEEMGARGAKIGAYAINPDQAIIMDVTFANTPETKRKRTQDFGGGAAIGRGPHMCKSMTDHLVKVAKENNIKYQIEVMPGSSGTTAGAIQLTREGVPTAIVSLPLKYMHSPVETICIDDAVSMSDLLLSYIKNPWREAFTTD